MRISIPRLQVETCFAREPVVILPYTTCGIASPPPPSEMNLKIAEEMKNLELESQKREKKFDN